MVLSGSTGNNGTALLSLNIHDALHFDGTPICLHPDLFSITTTANLNSTISDGGSALLYHTATTTTSSLTGNHNHRSALSKSNSVNNHNLIPLNATMSSDEGGVTKGSATTVVPSNHSILSTDDKLMKKGGRGGLQIGDLLEIRVWDPIKASTLNHNQQKAQILSSNNPSGNNRSTIIRQRGVQGQQQQISTSSVERHPSSQYSMASSTSSPIDIINTTSTSPIISTETTVVPSTIVAEDSPKTQSPNIVRKVMQISSSQLSKPPMQRRATTSLPIETAGTTNTISSNAPTILRSNNNKSLASRHVRDISDMTVDTITGGSTIPISTSDVVTGDIGNNNFDASTALSYDNDDSVIYNNNSNNTNMQQQQQQQTHQLRLSFYVLVTEKTLTSLKGSARTQISILRPVADLYKLSSYDMVSVHLISSMDAIQSVGVDAIAEQHGIAVDFLLVTIKDQFMSRGDMHYFQTSLIGSWIYQGERLYESTRGLQANAREIRRSAEHVLSGVVTSKTVITFRSRSSRIIWLVQMSSEMWDYSPSSANSKNNTSGECVCEIYFDKWITFIHKLFAKWKELEATHALTVVFFSRTYISSNQDRSDQYIPPGANKDVYDRLYEDHYRIVLENETCADWHALVVPIKKAFVRYPLEVGWTVSSEECIRRPSNANQGNVLEAINVTLNLLQFHYLDRDLQRTGNSLVVISAGNGVFEVDRNLAGITYQRMMDNGIGSDMLSLGLPALHIAPFFLFSITTSESQEQNYEVPHWMHLSFVSYESDEAVFVDHLLDPKDSKSHEEDFQTNVSGIEVAFNGFVLPSTYVSASQKVSTSPLIQPVSPARNIQPSRSSGRQLIEGRDFQDILEACRPRSIGELPTALKALLHVYDPKYTHDDIGESQHHLDEWGAFHYVPLRATRSEGSSKSNSLIDLPRSISPHQLSISPQRNMILLSATSSFESQSPSHHRSSHHDLESSAVHIRQSAQIQRSESLLLVGDDTIDFSKSFLAKYIATGSSNENEVDEDELSESRNIANTLRQMMREHDSSSASMVVSSKVTRKMNNEAIDIIQYTDKIHTKSQHGDCQGTTHHNYLQREAIANKRIIAHNSGVTSSGLDAALNQHRLTNPRFKIPDANRGNTTLSRTTSLFEPSGTTGQSSIRRNADIEAYKLSPLLLPPAVNSLTKTFKRSQNDDAQPPEQIPFSRRLVAPNDYSTSHKSSGRTNTSQLNDSNTALSESPPQKGIFGSPSVQISTGARSEQKKSNTPPVRPSIDADTVAATPRSWQRIPTSHVRSGMASRRKKLFNPFRQDDEDEFLAMKSHNRRRWSHVFPLGEVEFKRHAGPNWKSLTAPAILPLSIDYFPTQEEIDHNFKTGFHDVTLSEFEHKNFSSNRDLLIEMVRQRLTQDFQLVPEGCIDTKKYRLEQLEGTINTLTVTSNMPKSEGTDTIRIFLSMGHLLHTLTYYVQKDIIEVRRYTAKETQKNYTINYQYLSYSQETQRFEVCRQTFSKYVDPYNWNKVDNIICGDDDREMREGMRFKRIMFGIIPDNFENDNTLEEAYIAKFRRFLEYLEKLRDKNDTGSKLAVNFVTSVERQDQDESRRLESMPGVERNSMVRFYVQLRKGKRDVLEWMEVAIDATFDTSWTYRIMFNWLVASSGKVDAQVQLLQRRCTQYGLKLIPFPQSSVSRHVYLNPFKAPVILPVRRNKVEGLILERQLVSMDFIYDGAFMTDVRSILECIEDNHQYRFALHRPTMGKQFVHRTGTLFIRVLRDYNDMVIFVVFGNYRYLLYMNRTESITKSYHDTFQNLKSYISTL